MYKLGSNNEIPVITEFGYPEYDQCEVQYVSELRSKEITLKISAFETFRLYSAPGPYLTQTQSNTEQPISKSMGDYRTGNLSSLNTSNVASLGYLTGLFFVRVMNPQTNSKSFWFEYQPKLDNIRNWDRDGNVLPTAFCYINVSDDFYSSRLQMDGASLLQAFQQMTGEILREQTYTPQKKVFDFSGFNIPEYDNAQILYS